MYFNNECGEQMRRSIIVGEIWGLRGVCVVFQGPPIGLSSETRAGAAISPI